MQAELSLRMRYLFKMPTRIALLLLLPVGLGACANPAPFATTFGSLQPGSTMMVRLEQGTLNAYHPAQGEPPDRFTIAATAVKGAASPVAPRIRTEGKGVVVSAAALGQLLVRVPQDVTLKVVSIHGDVHITDISGNAEVAASDGNVEVMIPGYAQVRAVQGEVNVHMGATQWPGVLRLNTGRGDITIWLRDRASFHAHLYAANGTVFTDFPLRGSANGTSETIDGNVNGGGPSINIESAAGTVRLLELHPEP